MAVSPATDVLTEQSVRITMLGPFAVAVGDRIAGPWPRPSARRLCALVMVSPGRRVSRDLACEELFGAADPRAGARAVSKALSMARSTLAALGGSAADLLHADLTSIWASPTAEIDAESHDRALRAGLAIAPGLDRDHQLAAALTVDGELLADEPYADWALRPRARLAALRQEARLTLARDRAKGAGRSGPEAVVQAWDACLEHDSACEEAASALVRAYVLQGNREAALRSYQRCTAALAELGLPSSPSLDAAYAAAATLAPARSAVSVQLPAEPEPLTEEVRTVSVLSAGVSAPAGLVAGHGLEAVRAVVSASIAAVSAEVEALGGTVTAVSGSGLQAMFGAPEAHEDDPERAVRAAFRALSSAGEGSLALRIGVETGPAVLGPLGHGARVEYAAVGDVVDAAAGMQTAARQGSVLVGPRTHAAVAHLFTWGATEQVPLGRGGRPVTGTYLDGPKAGATSRALRRTGRSRLVGREQELGVLTSEFRAALAGRGSVVLLTGDAGLGKTRLIQEVRDRLTARTGTGSTGVPQWLEGRCASYASATPYGLYQQLLASWIGVALDQRQARLQPALATALAAAGAETLLPPLARLMGLPAGAALGRKSPADLQRATFAAVHSLVMRLASRGPTVLVLEDLHWADPTSMHLTGQLAALAAGRRLLILATSRPDAEPQLDELVAARAAGPAVRRIRLGPLPAAAELDLARSLLGEGVGQDVLNAILSGADGNPLFLEERLSSLRETGVLVHEGGTWHVGESADVAVPQVLERLVRSRVDRLSRSARDVVRVASVLGAQFPVSLLTAVGPEAETLEQAVDELRAKDFLRADTGPGEPTMSFRHAVIQEAIYNGLLSVERGLLHGRAAWALEAASAGRVDELAARLGRHFAAAGDAERAVRYLKLAGDRATDAFANDEAVSGYRAALAMVTELPPGERATAAADLHAGLANVLWRTGRRAAARKALQDALTAAAPADAGRRAHLLTRLGRLELADRRKEAAAAAFDAAQVLVGAQPADDAEVTADQWLELMVDGRAALYQLLGEPDRALATLAAARPVLVARGIPARMHSFYMYLALARVTSNGFRADDADIAIMRQSVEAAHGSEEKDIGYARYFLGRLQQLHGDLDEARVQVDYALAIAERIGESHLVASSLLELTVIALRQHDSERVRSSAPRAVAAAEAISNMEITGGATACLGWLAWQDGRPADVIARAAEVARLQQVHDLAGSQDLWVRLWPLVAVHLDAGRVADAAAAARDLLGPGHPWQPDDLTRLLTAAVRDWRSGNHEACGAGLAAALQRARDLRHC